MANLEDFETVNTVETAEVESLEIGEPIIDNICEEMILENAGDSIKTNLEAVNMLCESPKETTFESDINFDVNIKAHYESSKNSKESQERDNKQNNENASDVVPDKVVQFNTLSKTKSLENEVLDSYKDTNNSSNHLVKKIINLPDAFTDSSHSSSSELQSSAAPFESSSSSQENHANANRIDFENAIESEKCWKEANESFSVSTNEMKMEVDPAKVKLEKTEPALPSEVLSEKTSPPCEIPLITIDENTQPSALATEDVPSNNADTPSLTPGFIPPPPLHQPQANDTQNEIKVEIPEQQAPSQPVPPVIPPAPRKRGRPRKQVLPNPSPLMESWGSNAQEFPAVEAQKQERKRSARGERRQSKKKKFEDGEGQDGVENVTRRRKTSQATPKKKRRSTYVPKKKGPPLKKKHSEIENIQNFEEETRMSASEGPGGFSSKSGAAGDESQGSSATTDGPARSNVNKKGRMEVGTDGCKPVTVQQIVEYFWPPPSSLPHGEKPEGLMIQEQITEYLGVKSFKRKYPSIKRRPVDMEERNYLQENGFVSENMCDMGLTAVFAADIIEIMYNDFPHKFEEYRKYTREKKAKEQRALREKQAAERADMDPKKEAVESTISWNSEFNKTRSMDVPKRSYNTKVLLGYWFEKNCEDELKLAMYVKMKERRNLLIIKVRELFDNFLKPVVLSIRSTGIAYGDNIQLFAPDVFAGSPGHNGVVLAVTVNPNEIENTPCIFEDLYLVGSPIIDPCARNTFILESCEGKKEGDDICYGDTFFIKSACGSDFPLYVNLPVAVLGCRTGRSGFPNPQLKLEKSYNSRFKVVHRDPKQWVYSDGRPCPASTRVIFLHAPCNAALCVESDYRSMSLFSHEYEISGHSKLDISRQYLNPNIWMLLAGSV